MRIIYLPTALDDIAWFRRYYAHIFPAGGTSAKDRLKAVETLLRQHPEIGIALPDYDSLREIPIYRTPFTLLYRVQRERIDILRLYDQRSSFSNQRKPT